MGSIVNRLSGRLFTEPAAIFGAAILLLVIIVARSPFRAVPDSLFVGDGFGYYIYLPSVVLDGDVHLANQLTHQPDQPDQQWYAYVEKTDRPGNCFQVGCAVLWSPFFLLSHAAILCLNQFGMGIRTDGFGFPYELPVYLGSFCYGLLGLRYMRQLITELYGETIATVSTFYVATTTALAAYLWFEPDMSHTPSMFLISALFCYLSRIHKERALDWKKWSVVGFLIGLIVSVRATDVWVLLAAVPIGIEVCGKSPGSRQQAAVCICVCALCALFAFLPQMAAWKVLYGGYLSRPPGVYQKFDWSTPKLIELFVGLRRGIFVWTPLLAFCMAGLVMGFFRGPRFLRYCVPVLAFALYFNSVIPKWWVGASFSERRMVDYSVIFAVGLAHFLSLLPKPAIRKHVQLVGLPLCLFNWVLMLRYFTHDLPEYGAVSAYDLIVKTFLFPVHVVWRILN